MWLSLVVSLLVCGSLLLLYGLAYTATPVSYEPPMDPHLKAAHDDLDALMREKGIDPQRLELIPPSLSTHTMAIDRAFLRGDFEHLPHGPCTHERKGLPWCADCGPKVGYIQKHPDYGELWFDPAKVAEHERALQGDLGAKITTHPVQPGAGTDASILSLRPLDRKDTFDSVEGLNGGEGGIRTHDLLAMSQASGGVMTWAEMANDPGWDHVEVTTMGDAERWFIRSYPLT